MNADLHRVDRRSRRKVRTAWSAVFLIAASLIGACGSGDSQTSASEDTEANEYSEASKVAFCDAFEQISTQTDPAIIYNAYDVLEANSPPEIAGDVETFVANGRELSDAILALGDDPTEAEVQGAVAGVSADARKMIDELGSASQTGEIPTGAAGSVLSYGLEDCNLG